MHMLLALAAAASGFTAVFGGDLMFNGIPVKTKSLDGVAAVMRRADVSFANLEIPLTTSTQRTSGKSAAELKARTQFILKADPRHLPKLQVAGIDLVSLGNNHAMDYGWKGLSQEMGLLDGISILHTGAGKNAAQAASVEVYTTPDGTKLGLLSALAFLGYGGAKKCTPAAEGSPGVNWLNLGAKINDDAKAKLQTWIASAKAQCDLVVVALHGGIERKSLPTPYQVNLARACIDAGADIVWGHHPHVLQGAELYKGKPILYSMGNLISALPAATGLVTLRYEKGKFVRFWFQPALIAAGKVRLAKGGEVKPRKAQFRALSDLVQKKYPNKESKSLY